MIEIKVIDIRICIKIIDCFFFVWKMTNSNYSIDYYGKKTLA